MKTEIKTSSERSRGQMTSLLYVVFFFSGFAALIYQVAWQRLLTVHYGVGTISVTLIVSVYMIGLGLGALLGGYAAERIRNKIGLYFLVEMLIGCFGLISLPFLGFLGDRTAGSSYVLSLVCMFSFLCIPTLLMGITLPLLTKIFNNITDDFFKTVSSLYFINTIGAAFGAFIASYFIISLFGLDSGIYVAVSVNFLLGVAILVAGRLARSAGTGSRSSAEAGDSVSGGLGRVAYLLVFVTGFVAIGYEIVWFRVVGVLVKASPYAFSTILAVYLTGIAIGSFWMKRYLTKHDRVERKALFFRIQFCIGAFVAISTIGYYLLTKHTGLAILTRKSFDTILHPPNDPNIMRFMHHPGGFYELTDIVWWSAFFVLVPTLLMGASFPLISALALSRRHQEGKTIGTVYFYNIVGNVFGGIVTGFILLSYLGTEITLLIFSLVGILFGAFATPWKTNWSGWRTKLALGVPLVVMTIVLFPGKGRLYTVIHAPPAEFVEKLEGGEGAEIETFLEEGRDGVIVSYQSGSKIYNYINGLPHGSRGMHFGHQFEVAEAASYAASVGNVLVIGYGTGDAVKTLLEMKEVEKITLVELNRDLMTNVRKIPVIDKELSDPRINLIIDDGRRILQSADERYDLILLDPIRSTTAYSNNLYSQQFFKLVKDRLKPEGVFKVWMDEKYVMPMTLVSCFDHARRYEQFCLASNQALVKRRDRVAELRETLAGEELELLAVFDDAYRGDESYIRELGKGYPINLDWKPVCEYYLGYKVKERHHLFGPERKVPPGREAPRRHVVSPPPGPGSAGASARRDRSSRAGVGVPPGMSDRADRMGAEAPGIPGTAGMVRGGG